MDHRKSECNGVVARGVGEAETGGKIRGPFLVYDGCELTISSMSSRVCVCLRHNFFEGMNVRRSIGCIIILALLSTVGMGCVQPGHIPPGLLSRYQQAVLGRSPQSRLADDGLGMLSPTDGPQAVPLRIWVQSGKMEFDLLHKGKRLADLTKVERDDLTQDQMDGLVRDKIEALVDKFSLAHLTKLEEMQLEFAGWRITVTPSADRKALRVAVWAVDQHVLTNKRNAMTEILGRAAPQAAPGAQTIAVDATPEEAVRLARELNETSARLSKDEGLSRHVSLRVRDGRWWMLIRRPWKTQLRMTVFVRTTDRKLLDERVDAILAILGKPLHPKRSAAYGSHVVFLASAEATQLALANSMEVHVVSFNPAISREAMTQAAAVFDTIMFGSLTHINQDLSTASALLSGKSHITELEAGVRNRTVTGADLSAVFNGTRTSDSNTFNALSRRYELQFTLSATQPLLRNAGPDFNLAELRIARLGYKTSLSQFRQQVLTTMSEVHTAYWTLAQALKDYDIQQRLLDKTIETRDRVLFRGDLDATAVEVKQAEAEVQNRRASLVRARKTIRDAQDQLVRILADKRLGLVGDYNVIPSTPPVTSSMKIDRVEQLKAALMFNPLLEQARLAIKTSDINIRIAKNQLLPVFDVVASVALQGLRGDAVPAFSQMAEHDYINYTIGGVFEYPIGNRAPRSVLRQRRYERLQAITSLQDLADQVALAVNNAVREVETTLAEIVAYKASVAASWAKLKSLEDTEVLRGVLTPEFLQVKLNAQRELADALRLELRATMDLNRALATLDEVTGTTLQNSNVKLEMDAVIDAKPLPRPKRRPTPLPVSPAN